MPVIAGTIEVGDGELKWSNDEPQDQGTTLVAPLPAIFASAMFCARKNKLAFPTFAKTTKLGEEVGELCEAVLNQKGLINKPNAGTPIEECADVVMTVLDVLQDSYPNMGEEELVLAFRAELVKKFAKWRTKMDLT